MVLRGVRDVLALAGLIVAVQENGRGHPRELLRDRQLTPLRRIAVDAHAEAGERVSERRHTPSI